MALHVVPCRFRGHANSQERGYRLPQVLGIGLCRARDRRSSGVHRQARTQASCEKFDIPGHKEWIHGGRGLEFAHQSPAHCCAITLLWAGARGLRRMLRCVLCGSRSQPPLGGRQPNQHGQR